MSDNSRLPGPNEPCWCLSGQKYKRCHKPIERRLEPGRVSPMRTVPLDIERPDYAETGRPKGRSRALIRSDDVIERMRVAGRVAAEVLEITAAAIAPGITTEELDVIAHEECIRRGAYPSTLNYNGFPKSLCTSINEVICHGIPDDRKLVEGDIINLDFTAYIGGVHGDLDATYYVGEVDAGSRQLVEVTRECLDLGIAAVKPGQPISDIGRAIEDHASKYNYGVVKMFVGHGVAETFHCEPSVPHYFDKRASLIIQPGMTFTIEPMITMGNWRVQIWDDDWTAVTVDGSRTAQFEHTLLVTDDGADVLTVVDQYSPSVSL